MNVLHLLNDGPNEDASTIIDAHKQKHNVEIIDLTASDISYEEVVDKIDHCDRVISW